MFDKKQLETLGSELLGILEAYKRDRKELEIQWLKNLRQYRGKYDPSVAADIPEERSKVYPRDTRVKVKGGVAKMMEMMFPSQDRNFAVLPSPHADISKEDLEVILEEVQQAPPQDNDSVSDYIERRVMEVARMRASKMEEEIADQLADANVDYPQLCKRVVRSGYIYGVGVASFPHIRTQEVRTWQVDEETGEYKAKKKKLRRPHPEFVRIWDAFPDLTAKQWDDQEFFFERVVLMRSDLRKLADRNDFIKQAILDYLKENREGNYVPQQFEAELNELSRTSHVADRTSRRYELYRGVGVISGAQLASLGAEIPDAKKTEDIFAEFWLLGDRLIKVQEAPFGEKVSDQYHAFIYAEDEDSGLTGIGLPEEVRDSQMQLCASTRALMDNMAATAGPIFEVNTTLLARGRKAVGPIHAFKVIEREGDGIEAQYPAVRSINTDSHIDSILKIVDTARQQLDVESNLPSYTMGSMQQPLGEAFRTSTNMSMMLGSANMVTKDTVRAFDKFVSSLIGAAVRWNMEFNPREDIKGDFQAVAKGNMSLVAKEVRGAALDQFIMTLTPEERAILNTYDILIDRLRARDLPVDRVLPKAEAEQILASMREAASQASQIDQGLTQAKTAVATAQAGKMEADQQLVDATLAEIDSRIEANIAKAGSLADKTQLENLRLLLSTVQRGGEDGAGTTAGPVSPGQAY